MPGNNSEEGLSPDLTTGLVISVCVLKHTAGLSLCEMRKLYKKIHVSNRSVEMECCVCQKNISTLDAKHSQCAWDLFLHFSCKTE